MAIFKNKMVDDRSIEESLDTEEKLNPENTVETKLHFPDQWEMASKDRYVYQ